MQILATVVNFLLGLGASVFVPIIIIIAGLLIGMKLKDAVSSGITLGLAFTGMNMLVGFMTGAISPVAEALLNNLGIDLPILDGGWTTMSTISWSWPWAFLMFPLVVGINIIMLLINKTNVINADLWNVWGKIFFAVAVYAITGNLIVAFVIAGIETVIELIIADAHHHRIEKMSGIPGVTCTHRMIALAAPMYIVDMLLSKIPALNKDIDAEALRDKIGIFAENHVLGFILGVLFGILGRYDIAGALTLGVECATALTLFPVISKYFSTAMEPVSTAISDFMQSKFDDREVFVGLDWPFLGGASEIWLAIMWTIPVTMIMSFILPGNQILPFAGIINISIAVPAWLVSKGSIPKMLIQCTLFVPAFLWAGTAFAPFMTDLANSTGAVALEAGQMISNSSMDAPIFTYALCHFLQCLQGNFFPLIILVLWLACFVLYVRHLKKEEAADKAAA